ncbi:tyrosine-type recombinase/integrase [Segniliparus rotundus]|uniref:tyrosine-type recombinase/integrase n=1 Tax=Segniliparus rotundus TaxID=286802 RepID=UPI00031D4D79|nr:tyrosine-type recombinase/integrase [Segniliparus rotundus]
MPIIEDVRPIFLKHLERVNYRPDARLFVGPRGGRITTATLRDATHWDEVVTELGYEHLTRHDLRHTGLTWLADAGVKPHDLRQIAGHANLATTQLYIHPDRRNVTEAGDMLTAHLQAAKHEVNGSQRPSHAKSARALHAVQ